MKLRISILTIFAALGAQAVQPNRELAAGRDFYAASDFRRASVRFQVACDTSQDAEACYWAGMSYELLADIRTPFGCHTGAKARQYFLKAATLAPGQKQYRDALFDYLLGSTDCSRTALRQAAGLLSAVPESDPDYPEMLARLEEEKRYSASAGARFSRMFLLIPQGADHVAALASGHD